MIEIIVYSSSGLFIALTLLLSILILTQKSRHTRYETRVKHARDYLFSHYIDGENVPLNVSKSFFIEALAMVDEQIHLDPEIRTNIIKDIEKSKPIKKAYTQLNSPFSFRRKMAVYKLGRLRSERSFKHLFARFLNEKNEAVRLHIVANMRYGMNNTYAAAFIESFVGASEHYHKRLSTLLGSNYKRLQESFHSYQNDTRFDITLALVRLGAFHADPFITNYLMSTLTNVLENSPYTPNQTTLLTETILKNILDQTPERLLDKQYLNHTLTLVKTYAYLALAKFPSTANMRILIDAFDQTALDRARQAALAAMVETETTLIDPLIKLFKTSSLYTKKLLLGVFTQRLEYIALKLYKSEPQLLDLVIRLIIEEHAYEPLIDLLNETRDENLSVHLVRATGKYIKNNKQAETELRQYLTHPNLYALGLKKLPLTEGVKEKPPLEMKKIIFIVRTMVLANLLFPLIFIVRNFNALSTFTMQSIIEGFLIDANRYLVVYFVTINTVYITLLVFAFIGSKRQVKLSQTKKNTLLFQDKLLPGISIIAPAYNEALNIKESITSLLNISYPSYEVIVVNDGSKDDTLNVLIEHFKLERVKRQHQDKIGTKKIRGIYKTKSIPNLVVVDKQNGGKADALNVGINVSRHPFVCGIDADSILESDALLKLGSAMLEDTAPFVAMGGNIYPANGFTFDKGKVEKRAIAKEHLVRFQTIEYLRAFTSGRIGWSALRSLMIISGAFGLFQKEALIESGGYLTSSTTLKKDTVGEDMELVVRLTILELKKKAPHRVSYVYNAYCYTELPSDLKTLLKQRNRWQRGLIDILSYHRRIGFNPKYKQIGLIGYPYYFLFEFIGPFLELQGYLMLIIALFMGLLSPMLILGFFLASIGFGIIISLSSLFMSERELLMMNKKETVKLVLYAILENFGYRQMISLHRVFSTLSALKETGKWGQQKRKGFKT